MPPVLDAQAHAPVCPVLITGAAGTLGSAFVRLCAERGLACVGLPHEELDVADRAAVDRVLRETGAWAVVNASGYVRVDDAERDKAGCHRGNVAGAATLAAACAEHRIALLTFSSDLVFDGEKRAPYVESDPTCPLGIYGATKDESERRVLAVLPSALVVRTAWFFGPWDEWNFLTTALRTIAGGMPTILPDDQLVSPTYVPDLVHASLDLLIDGEHGVWHLANEGSTTPAALARAAARIAGLDEALVIGRPTKDMGLAATRPRQVVLESERGSIMPSLDHALSRYTAATRSAYHAADTYVRAAQ
jgi:dTDP-4-dehydrorhamnose reductase